jgi:hypothetical protein
LRSDQNPGSMREHVLIRILSGAQKGAVLALLLACGLVVLLASEVREQVELQREARRQVSLLHQGYFVPAVTVDSDAGDAVELGSPASGQFQLVFLYSEACEFSRASAAPWGFLAEQSRLAGLPIEAVAVLVDDPNIASPTHAERWTPPGGFVALPDARTRYLFRTGIVPQIALIDSSGRVVFHRSGVLELDTVQDAVLAHLASLTDPPGDM